MAQITHPDQKAFEQIGEQVYKAQQAPGFAFLVWSHGSVVFAKGYGFADVASKTPVTADTRFAIGSITKQLTAAAVLLLAEQRKLSLDDKLANMRLRCRMRTRSRCACLLNQDSGLHNYPNTTEHDWPTSGAIPPEKIIAILKTDKPDFAPGEKWAYSNSNYAVLAYIVARASGMTYAEFLKKNIFGPLAWGRREAALQHRRERRLRMKEERETFVSRSRRSASIFSTERAVLCRLPRISPAGTRHSSPASSSTPIRCTPSGPTAP